MEHAYLEQVGSRRQAWSQALCPGGWGIQFLQAQLLGVWELLTATSRAQDPGWVLGCPGCPGCLFPDRRLQITHGTSHGS